MRQVHRRSSHAVSCAEYRFSRGAKFKAPTTSTVAFTFTGEVPPPKRGGVAVG